MMDIKQILLSDASTDAKLSALAILIDKQFPKLENKVLEVEKLQGPVGDKGDKGDQGPQGERGKDGKDGKNGSNGKDGVDGKDGENGVSIDGVKIDFDGSLVVTLTDGRVINVGEIVPIDVAEKIRTVHNIQIGSGGDSQTVLDAIAALQATIATYGTMATQNANNVAITGGTINNTTIGATTPSTGVFTTLTATGQTSLGGAAGSEGLRVLNVASTVNYIQARGHITANAPSIRAAGSDTNIGLGLSSQGTGAISFYSSSISSEQMRVSHTASAVNYVQVTGAATGGGPTISAQGSDTNVDLKANTKGTGSFRVSTGTGEMVRVADSSGTGYVQLSGGTTPYIVAQGSTNANLSLGSNGTGTIFVRTNGGGTTQAAVTHTASAVNYVQVTGAATGSSVVVSSQGSDTNIGMIYNFKGTASHSFNGNNGTHFQVTSVASGANFLRATGSAASSAPVLSAQGSDTNIPVVVQSKGTGAIDLAAGSRGVNISNGGTVTAITRTVNGTGYTSIPALAISAPTTAGGVQATATPTMLTVGQTVVSGGSGYTVGDSLTIVGGTFTTPVILTVSTVSAGAVTGVTVLSGGFGNYSILPSTPASVTGGTGSGATFNLTWALAPTFTITNAGSGYVEQPTVTFSGGGGSGAAAYATVGSGTTIRGLGGSGSSAQSISFATPSGESFRVATSTTSGTSANYLQAASGATGNGVWFSSQGSDSNVWMTLATKGTGNFQFLTNLGQEQLRVAHTASAVNYVQVTGAATGGSPVVMSAQGSDTNVNFTIRPKGSGSYVGFASAGGAGILLGLPSGNANYFTAASSNAGSAPVLASAGSDTNIDLTLTPKGTGNVRFGTYTASMALTIQGYVEIKDAGGTIRKLAVIA